MNKRWEDEAWEDYVWWQNQDKKTKNRINNLIKDIERNGLLSGIGKPEKLIGREGYSRRIDEKNRLIYDMDENGYLYIIACKGHYDD